MNAFSRETYRCVLFNHNQTAGSWERIGSTIPWLAAYERKQQSSCAVQNNIDQDQKDPDANPTALEEATLGTGIEVANTYELKQE